MNEDIKPALYIRILGPLLFLSVAASAMYLFASSAMSLTEEIANMSLAITFNKGAMYLLGASIGASFLLFGVSYHSLFLRKIPWKMEVMLIRGTVAGVLIMFVFPQIVHFPVKRFIDKSNYVSCSEAEYSWLLYKRYVYTKDRDTCLKLANEIESSRRR